MDNINIKYVFFNLLFSFISCLNAQSDIPEAVNHRIIKKISISSEPDYPPYCIVDKNGNADGFSIDLFKAACKAVNIEVNINIGIWNQIKQDLTEGRIDALPLVGRSPEREPFYDFTFPYLTLHGAVFVRKGTTGINTVEDLKNKTIIVMKGDNAEEYVRRKNLSNHIITTTTFKEAFWTLADGEYDGVIIQRVLGIQLLKDLNINSVIPLNLQLDDFSQDFCFAVKKGNNLLLSRLNEGLSIVIANGTYDKIHLKWFGPNLQGKLALKDVIIIALYVFIPLSILFLIISILILRSEVRKRTSKLHELNATKDKFFSIIAHDLRSPFMGFLNLTKSFAEEASSYSAQELAQLSNDMHQIADNLFSLLNNLLSWAQMQKGSMTFQQKELSLSDMIADNVQILKNRSGQKGISIINMVTEPVYAFADDKMINSVLMNLLSNAVKFTRQNGTVTISAENNNDGMIEISVSDTGIGMPKSVLENLFIPGEKTSRKGTEGELSTGLGLLLCKEFIVKNGGSIRFESKEGVGSKFYFTLRSKE